MDWKKIARALLFPPIALMIVLVPFATIFLAVSMTSMGTESLVSIVSYVIAAYTLTVWCIKIPDIIAFFKALREENAYVRRWREDVCLRVNVSLGLSILGNGFYAVFQLVLGIFHRTFWFCSFGVYYFCLAIMRFFLVLHTKKCTPGSYLHTELKKYRSCGWILLLMNLALAIIVFFMVYWNRTFEHHMIVAIAMAAYTFGAFILAIVNVLKYRQYNSPVFSASKAISLVAAAVSVLTLESTMLTAFADASMDAQTRKWMLAITGVAVCTLVVGVAIYMIAVGTKQLKIIRTEVENADQQS